MDGVPISDAECAGRWRPWTPDEVAERLGAVASWGVLGGWAIDLFLGRVTRPHGDIEIAVPVRSFGAIATALAGFEWDVVDAVLPALDARRRRRLRRWLQHTDPAHPWLDAL